MKEEFNNEELIDKFIHDHLDENESKVFKEKFENESGFHEAVLQQIETITALKTVKEFQNTAADNKKGNVRRMRFLLVAASFSIMALAGIWLLLNYNQNNHEVLFAQYYTPFQVEKTRYIQDSSDLLLNLWKESVDFYANENYEEGIKTLEKILVIQPHDDIALFYLGQCLLNTHETDKAIPVFREILKNKESAYYNDAIWYLSLAYLKIGETSQSKNTLEEIINMEGFYKERAINLLKEIEKK